MFYSKKSIGAVVAVSLTIVVAVFAVIGFQTWYNSYQSGLFSDIETGTDVPAVIKINDVVGDTLYMKSDGLTESEYVQELRITEKKSNTVTCDINLKHSNLTGYYKLDGNVLDSSGNERHGTIFGNPKYVTGKNGKALEFDGINDYVDSNNIAEDFITVENATFMVWIKTKGIARNPLISSAVSYTGIVTGGSTNVIGISRANISNEDRIWVSNLVWIGDEQKHGIKYKNGEWIHITLKHSNNNLSVYKNGILNNSSYSENTFGGFLSTNLYIGSNRRLQYLSYFNGTIDDVRIYNVGLSDEEIKNIYTYGKAFDNKNIEFDLSECNLDKNKEYNGVIVTDKQVLNFEFYYN